MPAIEKTRLNSRDPEELAQAVHDIYCPHLTAFRRAGAVPSGLLEIRHAGRQPVIELRYGVPARVDAGKFPRLMLIRTCLDGSGSATQQGVSVPLRKGETVPMSAGLSTQLDLDARFAQRSVKLDIDLLEAQCSRLLNRPLERPLRFELRPFSAQLEHAWMAAVNLVLGYASTNLSLPAAAATSLDEFLISLVLTQHRHNYTDEFQARARPLPPRLIREAEHLMRTAGNELTVGDIAAHLRVSLRSLEAGFREYHKITPLQRLRAIRLEQVRERLLVPHPSTSVTSIALEHGFVHLARFSQYYKTAFGESPAQTLRRGRLMIGP